MKYKAKKKLCMIAGLASILIISVLSAAAGFSSGAVVMWYLTAIKMATVGVVMSSLVVGVLVGLSLFVAGACIPLFFNNKFGEYDIKEELLD